MVSKTNHKSIIYGIIAGTGLILIYILVVSFFQGLFFALLSLNSLKFWLIPLAAGFGIQISLYTSVKHTALLNKEVAASGGISGGSMIVCCTHYVLNIIPFIGLSGLSVFLIAYQKLFLGIGIAANVIGIVIMVNHKKKMNKARAMKGGLSN